MRIQAPRWRRLLALIAAFIAAFIPALIPALLPASNTCAAPICDAGGPYAAFVLTPIRFDGSGSHAPGGAIVSYAWSFGDGATATGPIPQHTYATIGLYTVTLTVTDDQYTTSSCTTTADIYGEVGPPVCDAGGPYYGASGVPIRFDGTGSSAPEGTIVSYVWSFGDGATGTGPTPEHAYAIGGYYDVTLVVTDDRQATAACTTEALVTPLPVEPSTWGAIKTLYR